MDHCLLYEMNNPRSHIYYKYQQGKVRDLQRHLIYQNMRPYGNFSLVNGHVFRCRQSS